MRASSTTSPAAGALLLLLASLAFVATARADDSLAPLVQLLGQVDDPAFHLDVLNGLREGLRGRKDVAMPDGWSDVYPSLIKSENAQVREQARALALLFNDPRALAELRRTMMDRAAAPDQRVRAIEAMVAKGVKDLAPSLHALVAQSDDAVAGAALRGLGAYADERTPTVIVKQYPRLSDSHKQDAIQTLASRPAYAVKLLEAMEQGVVPRQDVSAFTARQIVNLGDAALADRLAQAWGEFRQASQPKQQVIAHYRAMLTPQAIGRADPSRGRLVYAQTCAQCHRMFGQGGAIGPELTGSQRANVDYLLENVIDPSALVAKEYQLNILSLADGRVLSGIIVETTDTALVVQTVNEKIAVPRDDVLDHTVSPISMMPEGLFEKLSDQQVLDLAAYLASPGQVELPDDEQGPPPVDQSTR